MYGLALRHARHDLFPPGELAAVLGIGGVEPFRCHVLHQLFAAFGLFRFEGFALLLEQGDLCSERFLLALELLGFFLLGEGLVLDAVERVEACLNVRQAGAGVVELRLVLRVGGVGVIHRLHGALVCVGEVVQAHHKAVHREGDAHADCAAERSGGNRLRNHRTGGDFCRHAGGGLCVGEFVNVNGQASALPGKVLRGAGGVF